MKTQKDLALTASKITELLGSEHQKTIYDYLKVEIPNPVEEFKKKLRSPNVNLSESIASITEYDQCMQIIKMCKLTKRQKNIVLIKSLNLLKEDGCYNEIYKKTRLLSKSDRKKLRTRIAKKAYREIIAGEIRLYDLEDPIVAIYFVFKEKQKWLKKVIYSQKDIHELSLLLRNLKEVKEGHYVNDSKFASDIYSILIKHIDKLLALYLGPNVGIYEFLLPVENSYFDFCFFGKKYDSDSLDFYRDHSMWQKLLKKIISEIVTNDEFFYFLNTSEIYLSHENTVFLKEKIIKLITIANTAEEFAEISSFIDDRDKIYAESDVNMVKILLDRIENLLKTKEDYLILFQKSPSEQVRRFGLDKLVEFV